MHFNLSLGGDLVHSLISQEASRFCCCHLLATSKICCIFTGLRTNPSFCGLSALGFEQTASVCPMSLAGRGFPGFSLRSSSCCVAEPSVPVVFQRDSDYRLSVGAVEPTFPLFSSLYLIAWCHFYKYIQLRSGCSPGELESAFPCLGIPEHACSLGGKILPQLSFC